MNSSGSKSLTLTQWLILVVAAIGFAFDIYELLMLPLIIKPAIAALSAPLVAELVRGGMAPAEAAGLWAPGGVEYVKWARTLFFVPAIAGGVFGLLGGYLTDRLGRRRVLTFSILLYAFAAFSSGFITSLPQLLFLRCLVFIGVCVEFVAAVAWLAELFPNPLQREKVLGYTQAFSSVGGLMVGSAAVLAAKFATVFPEIRGGHEAWRYTLISGVFPALPLIIIRPFLPESPAWAEKKKAGTLRRPSIAELFSPALARTTIITTLVFAASYGIAFGAIQQLPQILGGPKGHAQIVAQGKAAQEKAVAEASEKGLPAPDARRLRQIFSNSADEAVAKVTIWQEIGGLVGRFLLAIAAVQILSRRTLLRIFQIPALIFVPLFFWWISRSLGDADSLRLIQIGVFVAGLFTVAQFSFWGNYIPLVFPIHLRGTGESFAANIGGRILGTSAAWLTLSFSQATPPDPAKIATVGACVAGAFVLVGAILTHWLPEPKAETET
ncbi:MAG TPA: MFS transporter [Methylomirabilota bacterium]|nr:MFS transporter [Methylomirabilota bacterium]